MQAPILIGGLEPAEPIVHRTDLAGLSRQMQPYGSGCTAALTALAKADARAGRELPPKIISGAARMLGVPLED